MSYSPYAPPRHDPQPYAHHGLVYQPLGWKTTAGIVGIVAMTVLNIVVTGMLWAVGAENLASNLPAAGAIALLGLLLNGIMLFTYVVFLVWMHQAAKNVRTFGHAGLTFTPGWCVGWWFVPFASLWKPYQAMREIWRASDPDAVATGHPGAWMSRPVPATFGLWWAAYILAGAIGVVGALAGNLAQGGNPAISMVAHVFYVFAAVGIVIIMKQLAARQELAAEKVRAAAEQGGGAGAGYGGYGGYGPPGYAAPGYGPPGYGAPGDGQAPQGGPPGYGGGPPGYPPYGGGAAGGGAAGGGAAG